MPNSTTLAEAAREVAALVRAAQATFERLQESAGAGEGDAAAQARESVRALSDEYDTRLQVVTAAAAALDQTREHATQPATSSAQSTEALRRERDELAEAVRARNGEVRTQMDMMRQLLADMQIMQGVEGSATDGATEGAR